MDIALHDPDANSLSCWRIVAVDSSGTDSQNLTRGRSNGQGINVVRVWSGEIVERSVQSQGSHGWILDVNSGSPVSGRSNNGEVEGSSLDDAEVLGVASSNVLNALLWAVGIACGEGHSVVVDVHLGSRVINDQHVDAVLSGCNFVVELGTSTTALSNGAYCRTQSVGSHRPVIDHRVQVVSAG